LVSFIVVSLIIGVFALVAFVGFTLVARNAQLARRAEASAAVAMASLTELRRLADSCPWDDDERLLISAAIQRVERNTSYLTKELA
jgi:type II secretory pathway pseudopilin PulG